MYGAPIRKPNGLLFAGVSTAFLVGYSYVQLNSKAFENQYVLSGQNPYGLHNEFFGLIPGSKH